jgi:pimeloyl-ACP methyl ester carboxylesterase/DNA-binding CsgD family transcriptional regulator
VVPRQQIRFCSARDGIRLAFASHGRGPPVVRVATWLTHLDFDWDSPIWRHWLDELGAGHTLVRYDERGCGMSDHEIGVLGIETWVGDLESVVAAAGLERFVLLGVSQGAAVALVYAARHPDRVSHLVLYGGYARGRRWRGPDEARRGEAMIAAIRAGWTRPDPTFRHLFSMLFLPNGTPEQMAWYDDLLRRSTPPASAAAIIAARDAIDVTAELSRVAVPTLVAHARCDHVVPVEEGRILAAGIPQARLHVLESDNHILLAHEPAWDAFLAEFRAFTRTPPEPARDVEGLSARELDVLALVAAGAGNEAIADELGLSVRTVERHLSNVYAKLRVSGKAGRTAAAVRFAEALRDDRHAAPTGMRDGPDAGARGRP